MKVIYKKIFKVKLGIAALSWINEKCSGWYILNADQISFFLTMVKVWRNCKSFPAFIFITWKFYSPKKSDIFSIPDFQKYEFRRLKLLQSLFWLVAFLSSSQIQLRHEKYESLNLKFQVSNFLTYDFQLIRYFFFVYNHKKVQI